jgi:hypothetical protein
MKPAAQEIEPQTDEPPAIAARSLKIERVAAPIEQEVEPIAGQHPPIAPVIQEIAPAAPETAPVIREIEPAAPGIASVVQEIAPVVHEAAPAVRVIAPVEVEESSVVRGAAGAGEESPGMAVAGTPSELDREKVVEIRTEPPRQIPGRPAGEIPQTQERKVLELHNRQVSGRLNRRFPVFAITAIAATFLLALGGAFLLVRSVIRGQHPAGPAVAEVRPLPGRAPNPYERWIISPEAEKRRLAQKPAPAIDPHHAQVEQLCRAADSRVLASSLLGERDEASKNALFSALIARRDGMDRYLDLLLNSRTREAALSTLQSVKNPPTRQFLASLDDASVARRLAAAKALGSVCDPRMIAVLRQMIEQGDHQREALAVLSECSDSNAMRYVQQIKRQPALASQLTNVRNEMRELF